MLLIVALVYLSEDAARWSPWKPDLTGSQRLALGFLGPAIAIGACWIIFSFCRHRMEQRGSWRAVRLADRALALWGWLAIALHIFNLAVLDLLGAIRAAMGNWVIVDESLAVLPPVLIILGAWWCYYPINRRLRESSLIRHLDTGKPIYPIWTRRQYVLSQARLHFGLVLLPAMLIMSWAETVEMVWRAQAGADSPAWIRGAALAIGVGAIFLFAPTLMIRIWDTTPLGHGDLRHRLERLCASHRVRIRRLLVWHTHGGMINGAVMGLIGRLRYILLTDALLESMTTTQVEAVMAHEVGHARRHHLPWLAVCLIAILSAVGLATSLVMRAAEPYVQGSSMRFEVDPSWEAVRGVPDDRPLSAVRFVRSRPGADWLEPLGLISTVVISLGAFGWTSRRFERQADTFAIQHLSGLTHDGGAECTITPEAAGAMTDALQVVAELNHIPTKRRSWRHGSIRWRQNYLHSLIGRRCNALPIDRQMRLIQAVAAVMLVVSMGLTWWLDGFG